MKRPGFYEGVLVAVVASVAGAALYGVMATFFNIAFSARAMLALIGSAYLVYLLARSPKKRGRMTAVLCWALSLFGVWLLDPPFVGVVILLAAVLWLIRSLLYYRSVISSLVDLGLSGFGLVAGLWAFLNSGSLLLALWTLFLVQALFALIPVQWSVQGRHANTPANADRADPFMRAHRNAEAALGKLSLS